MLRYHNVGKSRRTKKKYSTTVIEAIGVEHKETTRYVPQKNKAEPWLSIHVFLTTTFFACLLLARRNYDILAAVFTDVLKHMHKDFGIV